MLNTPYLDIQRVLIPIIESKINSRTILRLSIHDRQFKQLASRYQLVMDKIYGLDLLRTQSNTSI